MHAVIMIHDGYVGFSVVSDLPYPVTGSNPVEPGSEENYCEGFAGAFRLKGYTTEVIDAR